MKYRKILRSLISYLPIFRQVLRKTGTGGTNSAEYCYDIWNFHKSNLRKSGVVFPVKKIGEIGPGDSIGVGLAALIDGVESYYGLDAIPHAGLSINISVFNQLKDIFKNSDIELDIEKERFICEEITKTNGKTKHIKYYAPWWQEANIGHESLDLIISNAVMEHVVNLQVAYRSMYKWLKPGGYCSHLIDYGAHEFSDIWHEHLYYNNFIWKFLMHGRLYPINRLPHSYHVRLLSEVGFEIVLNHRNRSNLVIARNKMSQRVLKTFQKDDFDTISGLIIVRKPK